MKNILTKTSLILIGVLLGLCWFVGAVSEILLPFVLAFVLAYMLNPPVERLAHHTPGRGLATVLVEGIFCLSVLAVFLTVIPIVQAQTVEFMRHIPQFSESVWQHVQSLFQSARETTPSNQLNELSEAVSGSVAHVLTAIGAGISRILSGGMALFNLLALILITPVILFYVLRDWPAVQSAVSSLIPKDRQKEITSLWEEINRTLSGFIRGQALVCLSLAFFYGIGLSLTGLDFGILVGILAGLLSFIPYFGFGSGLILSLFLGLMQGLSWGQWMALAIVFGAGQILEGYVLTPRLVGKRVGLSPVWVIFALLSGGVIFGFIGILVAVPTAAVIGVLLRRGLAWYRQTAFYRGKKGV